MIEDYYKWEEMSLSAIIWIMVKWFEFDSVNIEYLGRASVESGVWISVKADKYKISRYVNGQRPDIVKRRLIELLDSLDIRPKEFIPKEDKS